MTADLRNSLFALLFVLTMLGLFWAGSRFDWPEAVVIGLTCALIAGARHLVVHRASSRSTDHG